MDKTQYLLQLTYPDESKLEVTIPAGPSGLVKAIEHLGYGEVQVIGSIQDNECLFVLNKDIFGKAILVIS